MKAREVFPRIPLNISFVYMKVNRENSHSAQILSLFRVETRHMFAARSAVNCVMGKRRLAQAFNELKNIYITIYTNGSSFEIILLKWFFWMFSFYSRFYSHLPTHETKSLRIQQFNDFMRFWHTIPVTDFLLLSSLDRIVDFSSSYTLLPAIRQWMINRSIYRS